MTKVLASRNRVSCEKRWVLWACCSSLKKTVSTSCLISRRFLTACQNFFVRIFSHKSYSYVRISIFNSLFEKLKRLLWSLMWNLFGCLRIVYSDRQKRLTMWGKFFVFIVILKSQGLRWDNFEIRENSFTLNHEIKQTTIVKLNCVFWNFRAFSWLIEKLIQNFW